VRGRRARTTCGGGDGDGGAGCVVLRRGMSCAERVRQKSAKSAHAVQALYLDRTFKGSSRPSGRGTRLSSSAAHSRQVGEANIFDKRDTNGSTERNEQMRLRDEPRVGEECERESWSVEEQDVDGPEWRERARSLSSDLISFRPPRCARRTGLTHTATKRLARYVSHSHGWHQRQVRRRCPFALTHAQCFQRVANAGMAGPPRRRHPPLVRPSGLPPLHTADVPR
jgi:hypothetical protein